MAKVTPDENMTSHNWEQVYIALRCEMLGSDLTQDLRKKRVLLLPPVFFLSKMHKGSERKRERERERACEMMNQ